MKFLVQYKPAMLVDAQISVSADRWWDARVIGVLHFECEREFLAFEHAEYLADDEVDVETRWQGMPPSQRFQFRMRGGEWLDVGDYYDEKKRRELDAAEWSALNDDEDLGMEPQQER